MESGKAFGKELINIIDQNNIFIERGLRTFASQKMKNMSVQNITQEDFKSVIQSNDKVMVKYYADWCGSCKLIAPKYKRLSDDDRFSGITFTEANAEQNEAARKAAGVDNLPFFAIFKDGKFVEGSATSKEDYIVSLLDKLN